MSAHDELRARAEAATPGPWMQGAESFVDFEDMAAAQRRMLNSRPFGEPFHFVWVKPDLCVGYTANGPTSEANAAYIAAASPDVVLALLDEIAALRAERAWQPIETAPVGVWVLVYGLRFRASKPSADVARIDEYGLADRGGYSVAATHWMPLPEAP